MVTQLTTQSADVIQRATIAARLRHSLIIAVMLIILIAGAVVYGLFAQWASVQSGPKLAPGNGGRCHQGPMLGSVAPQFTEPTA